MKLKLKFFALFAVLGLGSAVESVAQSLSTTDVGVFAYTCRSGTDDIQCFIGQYASVDDATWDIFSASEVYDSWNALVTAMSTDPLLINTSGPTGVNFSLKTDLDFGGYKVSGSDTTCVHDFKPIDFATMSAPLKSFSGRYNNVNHVIRNYCQIGTGAIGFLGTINDCSINNLYFDNAYVNAKSAYRGIAAAGVVAGVARNVAFENIFVDRSKVRSYDAAGGIFGIDSLSTTSSTTGPALSAAVLQVDVDLNAPFAGGLIGRVNFQNGLLSFRSNTVSATFTGSAEDARVGGLVGFVTRNGITYDTLSASCEANNVTLKYEAIPSNEDNLYVGGLFGETSGLKTIKVSDGAVKTSISSAGYGNQYFGGLVGRARMTQTQSGRDSVVVRNNQVDVSIASTSTKNFTLTMGGLIGFGGEFNDGTNDYVRGAVYVSDNDVVTASMEAATSGKVYAGGLVGYAKAEVETGTSGGFLSTSTKVTAPEGIPLIATSSATMDELYAGGFAGLADFLEGAIEARRAYVQGDINIAAKTAASGIGVGGMFGKLTYMRANLYDNLSVGNISANGGNVGFVIGDCSSASTTKDKIVMYANIHQGTEDAYAKDAIGSFVLGGTPVTDWAKGEENLNGYSYAFRYNYRNAVESGSTTLEPTGALDLGGNGDIRILDANGAETGRVQNGVLDENAMTSRELAYILSKKTVDLYAAGTHDELDSSSQNFISFFCWENETGKLPHVCENSTDTRTAYKVEISLEQIKSNLKIEDVETLTKAGILYKTAELGAGGVLTGDSLLSVVTYTEKDGRINQEFADKVRFLTAKYGILDGTKVVNLDFVNVNADTQYDMDEDYLVKFEYQIYSDNLDDSSYMDASSYGPVFFLTPQTSVSRYHSMAMVPAASLLAESFANTYYVSKVSMECNTTVTTCPTKTVSGEFLSYADIMDMFEANLKAGQENVLRLRYVVKTASPKVAIGNGSERAGITVNYYGYMDGLHYNYKQTYAAGISDGAAMLAYELPAAYSASIEPGFELFGWNVDFWAYAEGTGNDIRSCYDSQAPAYGCGSEVTINAVETYFAGVKPIVDSLTVAMSKSKKVKMSRFINSYDQIYMDSIATAIGMVMAEGIDYNYLLMWTPYLDVIPYKINFNAKEGAFPLFIAGYTDSVITYSRKDSTTEQLPELFSTGACFEGWQTVSSISSSKVLNKDILQNAVITNNTFDLFDKWFLLGDGKCSSIATEEITLKVDGGDGKAQVKVILSQRLENPNGDHVAVSHEFTDNKLTIPAEDKVFRFHVKAETAQGYALDSLQLIWNDPGTGVEYTKNIDVQGPAYVNGPVVELKPAKMSNIILRAKFAEVIDVELVLNTDTDEFFYDISFNQGEPLQVRNSGSVMFLPTWIYTTDACVVGWAYKQDAVRHDIKQAEIGKVLYQTLYDTRKLYAIWGDANECIASAYYVPVTAESKHGEIELIEGDGKGGKRTHKFNYAGRMILPEEPVTGGFTVHGEAATGYYLDSIVMKQGGSVLTLSDGDAVNYGSQGFDLVAAFAVGSAPSGPVLAKSGNAIRFTVDAAAISKTSSFYDILLVKDDGSFIDTARVDCPSLPCLVEYEKYPLKSGHYKLTVKMADIAKTTTFMREFDVAKEIAAGKSWHMVALSDVDMEGAVRSDKEKVYWWDENAKYGVYWQYQAFTSNTSVQQGLGYWYRSNEGKPLKLNEDAFDGDASWSLDSVNSGWNLLSNPYGWHINIGAKSNPDIEFWSWNEKTCQYDPVDSLKPYEAVWAKVHDGAIKSWALQREPVFVDSVGADGRSYSMTQKNRALAKPTGVSGSGWSLRVVLSDGNGKMDSWNTLGVGERAVSSEEPPAGMGDRVNLSILGGGKRLAKSVKAASEGAAYEWTVELSATSARRGYLAVEGADALLESGLHVYVTVDGQTQEIHAGEKLPVDVSSTAKTASVRVAPTARKVVAPELRGIYVVKAGGALQVAFDAAGMGGSRARVDVFDMRGVSVASTAFKAADGRNTVSLTVPRRGLYMVRVAVAGQVALRRVLFR